MFQFPGHPGQVPEAVAGSQPLQVQGHGPAVGEEKVGGGGIAVNEHLAIGKILAAPLPGLALRGPGSAESSRVNSPASSNWAITLSR